MDIAGLPVERRRKRAFPEGTRVSVSRGGFVECSGRPLLEKPSDPRDSPGPQGVPAPSPRRRHRSGARCAQGAGRSAPWRPGGPAASSHGGGIGVLELSIFVRLASRIGTVGAASQKTKYAFLFLFFFGVSRLRLVERGVSLSADRRPGLVSACVSSARKPDAWFPSCHSCVFCKTLSIPIARKMSPQDRFSELDLKVNASCPGHFSSPNTRCRC